MRVSVEYVMAYARICGLVLAGAALMWSGTAIAMSGVWKSSDGTVWAVGRTEPCCGGAESRLA